MKQVKLCKMPIEYVTEVVHEREEFSEDLAILKMYWMAARDGARDVNGLLLKERQFFTSAKHLAKDWKWSEECVYKFLHTLSSGYVKHIKVEELAGDENPLIITMLKYDEFVVTA